MPNLSVCCTSKLSLGFPHIQKLTTSPGFQNGKGVTKSGTGFVESNQQGMLLPKVNFEWKGRAKHSANH